MRVFKRKSNGYYYCEIKGKRFSLGTKDDVLGKKLGAKLEKELLLLNVYKKVFTELKRVKSEIEEHYSRIIRMIENSEIKFEFDEQFHKNSKFVSEAEMQEIIIEDMIKNYEIKNVEQYKECENGILDAVCRFRGRTVILEFKAGPLEERYLGQCIRYLNNKTIKADELWLIGESVDKTSKVFDDFNNIYLFVTTKSARAKSKIKPVHLTHLTFMAKHGISYTERTL